MPKSVISARAKRVWERLLGWYGTRLVEQYGEAPPPDWCDTVDQADNETVKRALDVIRSKYVAHPPTFPQFSEAFAPIKTEGGRLPKNTSEILSEFVLRNYGSRLSPKQLRGPWTSIGKYFDAKDLTGKVVHNHGVEVTGIVIGADGDFPGYRVMVSDMQAFGEAK